MTVLGSAVLQTFFQDYLDTDLTYTKEVTRGLGLLASEATLRWQGESLVCRVHSSSFRTAKVVVQVSAEKARAFGGATAILTLAFLHPKTGKKESVPITGITQVLQSHTGATGVTLLVGLTFTHRPADTFLETQGAYLALKKEANQRREERIPVNQENRSALGLAQLNTTVVIDHIERKCMFRDVSYGGARVLLTGVAAFLVNKPFVLALPLEGQVPLDVPGTIVRAEAIEGHKGLAVIALAYDADKVPPEYLRALQKAFKLGLGNPRDPSPRT